MEKVDCAKWITREDVVTLGYPGVLPRLSCSSSRVPRLVLVNVYFESAATAVKNPSSPLSFLLYRLVIFQLQLSLTDRAILLATPIVERFPFAKKEARRVYFLACQEVERSR